MSQFTGPLVIEEVTPGRRWRLREPISYECGREGSGRYVVAPAGFETDGASIPQPLRVLLAVWGTYGRAAAVHDLAYRALRRGAPLPEMPTRKAADDEFRIAMRACGTAPWLAWAMWASVRLFGWSGCGAEASEKTGEGGSRRPPGPLLGGQAPQRQKT